MGQRDRPSPPSASRPLEEPSMHRSRLSAIAGAALALAILAPSSALAVEKPEVFGPFVDTEDFIGFDCGDFLIRITGTVTTTFTASFDANDNLIKLVMRVRAPGDADAGPQPGRPEDRTLGARGCERPVPHGGRHRLDRRPARVATGGVPAQRPDPLR